MQFFEDFLWLSTSFTGFAVFILIGLGRGYDWRQFGLERLPGRVGYQSAGEGSA